MLYVLRGLTRVLTGSHPGGDAYVLAALLEINDAARALDVRQPVERRVILCPPCIGSRQERGHRRRPALRQCTKSLRDSPLRAGGFAASTLST